MAPSHAPLPRTLTLTDVVCLNIAAMVNFSLVPTVALYGWVTLVLWLVAFAAFFVPTAVAVQRLGREFAGEGGVYLWARRQFGELHGFLSGWCYWTNNLFYIPMQLIFIAGIAAYAGDEPALLGEHRGFILTLALSWIVITTVANVRGMGVGKWIQNLGALATALLGVLILFAAAAGWAAGHAEHTPLAAGLDWSVLSTLSVMCFAFIGVELSATLGDEIHGGARTLRRAAWISGLSALAGYGLVTAALFLLVPFGELGAVQGLMQAIAAGTERTGLGWLLAPTALLAAASLSGSASAWFAGSARVPFVAGLGAQLPASLGRVHPRWGSPHVALSVSALAFLALTLFNVIGSTVAEAYQQLLKSTVVIQLIPFLYLFLGLIRLDPGNVGSKLLGGVGFAATLLGILLAFVPTPDITNVLLFELKMVAGILLTLGIGLLLWHRSRKTRSALEDLAPLEPRLPTSDVMMRGRQ